MPFVRGNLDAARPAGSAEDGEGGARRALPPEPRGRDSGRRRGRDRPRRAGLRDLRIASRIIHLVAWQGKVFSREKGDLKNKILPFGIKAVRAKVYKEASWFDGKETIVLDYSKTSFLARKVRDEIREVSPRRLPRARLLGARQDRPLRAQVRPVTRRRSRAVPACADDRRARPRGRARRAREPARDDGRRRRQRLGARLRRALRRPLRAPRRSSTEDQGTARAPDPAQRLRRLRREAPRRARRQQEGIDRVFGHCEGYRRAATGSATCAATP